MFQRPTLRSIQGLPDQTSPAATYVLLGSLPVEAIQTDPPAGGQNNHGMRHFPALHHCKPTGSQGYQLQVLVHHSSQVGRQVQPPTPT